MKGPQHQVIALDAQRRAATLAADVATLDQLLSDDLRYVHSSAGMETKEVLLGRLASGDLKYHDMELLAADVRDYGDTVLVGGDMRLDVTSAGTRRQFSLRYLQVWLRRDDAWRMVSWQSTTIPPPA